MFTVEHPARSLRSTFPEPDERRRSTIRRTAVASLATAAIAASMLVAASPASAAVGPLDLGPTVTYTGQAPTGYSVTFRYQSETADSVQIYGEWYFSKPSSIVSQTTADLRLGADWQSGDVPAGYNNAWRTEQMTEVDEANGIWEWTTPLPSGTYTYSYTENCAAINAAGCTLKADPNNAAWNAGGEGTQVVKSQVYVPESSKFPTYDNDYQQPLPASKAGTLENRSYPSPLSTAPLGTHNVAVYLPNGYDADREIPYPTLYISHGAGGSEVDWTTEGASNSIIDNAIADGDVQPMVVIATNFNGLPGGSQGYADEVKNNVIPFVEANYNVSTNAADRAFGGLSAGGSRSVTMLYDNTSTFEYFGLWSAAGAYLAPTADQLARIREVKGGIHIGAGNQDWLANINLSTQARQAGFTELGIPFTGHNVDGIHSWDVWRQELNDFVRRVAFKTTTVQLAAPVATVKGESTELSATVETVTDTGGTAEGSVAFSTEDGTLIGRADVDADGRATLQAKFSQTGTVDVAAVYEGSDIYNAATSDYAAVEVEDVTFVVPEITVTAKNSRFGSAPSVGIVVSREGEPVTGSVLVKVPGEAAESVTLVDGAGAFVLSPSLDAGTYEVAVSFAGNADTTAALTTATVTVKKAVSTATLSLNKSTAKAGSTTIRATAKVTAPVDGVYPGGSVTFSVNGKAVSTKKLYQSSKGTITISLPKFTKTGTSTVTVEYSGNDNFGSDSSPSVKVKVTR